MWTPSEELAIQADISARFREGFREGKLAAVRWYPWESEDRFLVDEVKGKQVAWLARGDFVERTTVQTEVFEPPRAVVGFSVEGSLADEDVRERLVTEAVDALTLRFQEIDRVLMDAVQSEDTRYAFYGMPLMKIWIDDLWHVASRWEFAAACVG